MELESKNDQEHKALWDALFHTPFNNGGESTEDIINDTEFANILKSLSPEQRKVRELVTNGQSVFFTGAAGTGKSYLLQMLIKELRIKKNSCTEVTATTGIAALHIGGRTLHSFAGIGLGEGGREKLLKDAWRRQSTWRETSILIVDEISMLSAELFEHLEYIARKIRGIERPFGGIQLVLCGDFFQLPPVYKFSNGDSRGRQYCFEAECWNECVPMCIQLKKVFRQEDLTFVNILSEVRSGSCSNATLNKLKQYQRVLEQDSIIPTKLYSTNKLVEEQNMSFLNNLPTTSHEFYSCDKEPRPYAKDFQALKNAFNFAKQNCLAPEILHLKVGAQVMLLRNLSPTLVNGSRGVVKEFISVDMNRLEKLYIFTSKYIYTKDQLKEWLSKQKHLLLPVVEFVNKQVVIIIPQQFSLVHKQEEFTYRTQLPLKLAWAITIHKCQGMTLDKVQVSLDGIFEVGQGYVALSRARCLEGLQIVGSFNSGTFRTSKKVLEFEKLMQRKSQKYQEEEEEEEEAEEHQELKNQGENKSNEDKETERESSDPEIDELTKMMLEIIICRELTSFCSARITVHSEGS